MKFNWLRKRKINYPDFWQEYEQLFTEKPPNAVEEIKFVVLDTETTGFNIKNDRILSIGAVEVYGNIIDIHKAFEVYLHQETFNPETVKIHGIIKNEKVNTLSEKEAIKCFLDYIGNSVLVAHHAGFDIAMLNQALKRLHLPKLKNRVLDTVNLYRATRIVSNLINREKNYSLDEIAEAFNIDTKDRHTAAGDAFITAIAFLKILGRFSKEEKATVTKLLKK